MVKRFTIAFLIIALASCFLFNINKEYGNYGYNSKIKLCSRDDLSEIMKKTCDDFKQLSAKYKNPGEDTNTYMCMILTGIAGTSSIYCLLILYLSQIETNKGKNTLKNSLMRMKYKDYIKKYLLKSYKYSFIFPLFILFFYIVSYYLSGHFDSTYMLDGYNESTFTFAPIYLKMGPLLLIYLLFLTQIYGMFFSNIGTILSFKIKNVFLVVILGLLCFLGINVFIDVSVMGITEVFNLTEIHLYNYNFNNIFSLLMKDGTVVYNFIKAILAFGITLIIILIIYRDKEKTVIEWEK